MGSALRDQLKISNINWSKILDTRSVVDLGYHEIYALAKIMPKISQSETEKVYFDTLKEAYQREDFEENSDMIYIKDLQKRMNISESKHNELLNTLKNESDLIVKA